jgi:hypothetical protein
MNNTRPFDPDYEPPDSADAATLRLALRVAQKYLAVEKRRSAHLQQTLASIYAGHWPKAGV